MWVKTKRFNGKTKYRNNKNSLRKLLDILNSIPVPNIELRTISIKCDLR